MVQILFQIHILATHPNMQEVWVFTTQGLNPKPVPKEKWERRFLNLSEASSLHHFVRCRFWRKSQDDGGSEVNYFDRTIHSSRDPGEKKKKTTTLLSLVLVTKPSLTSRVSSSSWLYMYGLSQPPPNSESQPTVRTTVEPWASMAHGILILQQHCHIQWTRGGDGKKMLGPCAVCISLAFVLLLRGFTERYLFTYLFI